MWVWVLGSGISGVEWIEAGVRGRCRGWSGRGRSTEPAAHYKFASFARFRCARQKMSQSFRPPLTLSLGSSPAFVSLFMLLGLNVSFCLGAHAKKYAETMSSIICIQFLPLFCHFIFCSRSSCFVGVASAFTFAGGHYVCRSCQARTDTHSRQLTMLFWH